MGVTLAARIKVMAHLDVADRELVVFLNGVALWNRLGANRGDAGFPRAQIRASLLRTGPFVRAG